MGYYAILKRGTIPEFCTNFETLIRDNAHEVLWDAVLEIALWAHETDYETAWLWMRQDRGSLISLPGDGRIMHGVTTGSYRKEGRVHRINGWRQIYPLRTKEIRLRGVTLHESVITPTENHEGPT